MKMLAVKMLWHMNTLSPSCFLITLYAVSNFPLTQRTFGEKNNNHVTEPRQAHMIMMQTACLHVPMSTHTQPVTFFPYAQTHGL